MAKKLVAYFSVSGVTARTAKQLAETAGAELFEIAPAESYTIADIDWTNPKSRSTVEMQDTNCRPALKTPAPDMSAYDTVYVGFPIWWGREPSVVDTFLDSANFNGTAVVPFCTSGGSGIEGASARIAELTAGKAKAAEGKRISADAAAEEIAALLGK